MQRGGQFSCEWTRVPVFRRSLLGFALTSLVMLPLTRVEAVIIIGSSAGNTSAPADAGLATRWNQVGNFNNYLGTPIASQYFLTAKHLTDLTGQAITFPDATSYTTTAAFFDPNSDLAIYQISGTFPNDKIVPRYSGSLTASGQSLTIFGRGVPRTDTEVIGQKQGVGTEPKGWTWGTATNARSWGTNTLDLINNAYGTAGLQLQYDFDFTVSGTNEGMLSDGDSGGPVFILQSSEWRLAGINYAAGPLYVRETAAAPTLSAAVYDYGGLYLETSPGTWQLQSTTQTRPAVSLSTDVSARSTWINSVITVPEPWTLSLVGVACLPLLMRWTRRRPMRNNDKVSAA